MVYQDAFSSKQRLWNHWQTVSQAHPNMFFIKQMETISFLAPIHFWKGQKGFLGWLMFLLENVLPLKWQILPTLRNCVSEIFFMLLETRFDFVFVLVRTLHGTHTKLDSHQLLTSIMYCSPIMPSICIFFPAVPPTQTCVNIGTMVGVVVALVVGVIIMGVVIGVLVARNRRYKLSLQQHAV